VAQALVHDPQVIIVDEPTVGLDPEERLRFRQLMANLGRNRTIVLSTHIVADLGSGCHDLALIDNGKIVHRGSPAELVQRARGKVFEVLAAPQAAEQIAARYEIVSRAKEADGTRLRAVAGDGQLPEGARPADEPTLEEAYLAFMAARGRAEAALEEEESQ
jgi:ABC-type multidrug transport system ATPase subunit